MTIDSLTARKVRDEVGKLKARFNALVEQHFDRISAALAPFEWKDAEPLITEISSRHQAHFALEAITLEGLLKLDLDKKLHFEDEKFLGLEHLEGYLAETKKESDPLVSDFLRQQRLLSLMPGEELKMMRQQSEEIFQFEAENLEASARPLEKIFLLQKCEKSGKIYAFLTNEKVLIFDEQLKLSEEKEHAFGGLVTVKFFENVIGAVNRVGSLFLADSETLKPFFSFHFALFDNKRNCRSLFHKQG